MCVHCGILLGDICVDVHSAFLWIHADWIHARLMQYVIIMCTLGGFVPLGMEEGGGGAGQRSADLPVP